VKTFSNSRLSCYENCPWQFKLKYIDEVDIPDPFESIEIFLGLRTHQVLEKLYLELQKESTPSLEELLIYYQEQWSSNFHPGVRLIKRSSTLNEFLLAGKQAISSYYERYYPFKQTKILASEYQVTFPLDQYQITGFIDRLDQTPEGHYEIHDYKTSSRLPTKADCMRDRQLALYHMGILEAFPEAQQIELVWHYLRFDQEIRLNKSAQELEECKRKTLELIHTIEKDQCFAPKESALCSWCEYGPLCPVKGFKGSGSSFYPKNKPGDKPAKLLQRYAKLHQRIQNQEKQLILLRKEMNHLRQEIDDFSQTHQCQEFHNPEVSLLIEKRKRICFPENENKAKALQQWLEQKQLWNDLSSLDLQKIRNYMQNHQADPGVKKKLLEFADISESSEFRLIEKNGEKSSNPV
jgi:putative RecB family exonuclease